MKTLSSYRFLLAVFTAASTLELLSLGEANKNLPSPFKGFGYRLFTKHPAPGTNEKGQFNFVHLSLPHPQFPVFEPFPDILSPLNPLNPLFPSISPPFPPVDPSRRPASGMASGKPGRGTVSGHPGMAHSGMGHGGAGATSGDGMQPTMGTGTPGSTSTGTGAAAPGDGMGGAEQDQGHDGSSGNDDALGGDGNQHGESPMSEGGNSDGGASGGEYEPEGDSNLKPTNENEPGYDNMGSSDGGNSGAQPAPEDGMLGDEGQTPDFIPETNGPTGGGTNGPSGGGTNVQGGAGTNGPSGGGNNGPSGGGNNGPSGGGNNGPGGAAVGGPGIQIDPNAPICLYKNYSGLNLCTNDPDYPSVELKAYIQARYSQFVTMYADIAELSTQNSVDGLGSPHQETYICQTKVKYWKPLRARNSQGLWKIIVNVDQFTQTVRIETCSTLGRPCSMVPPCFPTSCVQKHVYHRMLTFDPWNHYYPFKIDLFRIPASCSCLIKSPRYDP